MVFRVIAFAILCAFSVWGDIAYDVVFEGRPEDNARLKEISHLIELKDKLPKTKAALERRILEDISNLHRLFQSRGYYAASIDYALEEKKGGYRVHIRTHQGPTFVFGRICVEGADLTPQDIGLTVGNRAKAKRILQAKETLLNILAHRGFPAAKIEDMDVIVDLETKTLDVTFAVDTGQRSVFGKTKVEGLQSVHLDVVRRKIRWKKGGLYNPDCVEMTQQALDDTGLFQCVEIQMQDALDAEIPMTIALKERAHRSVGLGLGFSTQRGAGIAAEWEHRNVCGRGETLKCDVNWLLRDRDVSCMFIKPDFRFDEEDLILGAKYNHDETKGYTETSGTLSCLLERRLSPTLSLSYGVMYKQLRTTDSDEDGEYNLLKLPLSLSWDTTDDILDPTCGFTLTTSFLPSKQLRKTPFFYAAMTVLGSCYKAFGKKDRFVIANRVYVGTIFGAKRQTIPSSERFYGGSDVFFRGYRYHTVSPLDGKKPVGGRSIFCYSLEGRYRISEDWGGVLFYDVGNVWRAYLPKWQSDFLHSLGLGVRYYTPVGPVRLDVAFPLKRRRGLDRCFEVYFSVGQSF